MASNRIQFNKKFKISKLNMKSLDLLRFFISVYIVLTRDDSLANKDDSEFNVSFYSNIHTLTLSFQGKIVQKENKTDSFFTI